VGRSEGADCVHTLSGLLVCRNIMANNALFLAGETIAWVGALLIVGELVTMITSAINHLRS
jgi:hypothetical protein